MREIKFRAWVPKWKSMVYFGQMYYNWIGMGKIEAGRLYETNPPKAVGQGHCSCKIGRIEEETPEYHLMQYTGLKDKDGKEIYEGDTADFVCLLNSNDQGQGDRGSVTFSRGSFYLGGIALHCMVPEQIEVVGNIYENPELLEGD